MPTPKGRCKPFTSLSELRSQIIRPFLFEGQLRRRFEPAAAESEAASPRSGPFKLQFNLGGSPTALQLDGPTHEENLATFKQLLSQLRDISPDISNEQLERVECLLDGQAAQANLEGLWQLFHRAIYSSQCDGHILEPLLLDALSSLVGPYAAHCEALLATAGAYLSLAVLGLVEPAMQQVVDLCERREREVADKDEVLAGALSHLGFELRSLQAMVLRFMEDRRYSISSLLVPRDVAALRGQLLERDSDADLAGETAESLEALLWQLQEGPWAKLDCWVAALEGALEGMSGNDDSRLLFMLSPTWAKGGRYIAVQSREFQRAQEVALEVLCMAAVALDLADRLSPAGRHGSPTAQANSQQRLLAAASISHSLVADSLPLLRASRSPFLEGLLVGYAAALELAEEVERREALLRVEEAEARADRAEVLCRELQQQVAAQRKAQRDVLRAQQQLTAAWFSVMEAQVDLSKGHRTCLEEARRQFRDATLHLTVPDVAAPLLADPFIDTLRASSTAAAAAGEALLGSGAGSPAGFPQSLAPGAGAAVAMEHAESFPGLDAALAIHGGP